MAEYAPITNDGKCIFCEIIAGRITTAGKFWENQHFMAWLSIDPNTKGFTCVVPRQHFGSDVLALPNDTLQEFIVAAKLVAKILQNYFDDVGRVGLIMEGTGIDHAHIKLVPLHGTEHLKEGVWKQMLSGKQFWFPKYEGWITSGSGPMAKPEELQELAQALLESQ